MARDGLVFGAEKWLRNADLGQEMSWKMRRNLRSASKQASRAKRSFLRKKPWQMVKSSKIIKNTHLGNRFKEYPQIRETDGSNLTTARDNSIVLNTSGDFRSF